MTSHERVPAPLYRPTADDEAAIARHMAWRASSVEAEQLNRLYSAVEHYRRMGWLDMPEHERWKYDGLIAEVRALVWPDA